MQTRAFLPGPAITLLLRWACFALLAICFGSMASAQISPGPLARAHQSLNGPSNCTECHAVSTRSASFRCTDCHREIANELQTHRGLHSTFPQGGAPGSACVKCHSDHNGENFNMIHWDPTPKGFDHTKTGFVLDGKHASTQCRACHTVTHISQSARALLGKKDLNRTWMGLSPTCTSCHEDKHQGRFGQNCLKCHNTTTWKGAKFDQQTFDHSKTRFPLTGKHATTACEKCHKPGDDGMPRYSGIRFEHCLDCHLDPHKGEFKQDCDYCHSTSTWTKSTFTTRFDHSKTEFPLLGKHAQVNCVDCHKSGDFKTKIPHAVCTDCHQDQHQGQFAKRPDGGKCESCHTVEGWSPSTFTSSDHAKTGFPLVPPHTNVKCAGCHLPAGKQTKFKMKYSLCVDCHKDEHQGQFAGDPWKNRCEQCHNGNTFKVTTYTITKHQKSNFPLTGGHMAVACNECHKAAAEQALVPYLFAHLSCTTCHEDIHHGEFTDRMNRPNPAGRVLGCESCHSTKDWHDLSKFDHSTTRFPLLGSHRAVECADCHKPPNLERTLLHVSFNRAPTACGECHEDPHARQFGAKEDDCASCHNSNKWKPSLFDHERTAFSLKGGHQNVACGACHTLKKEVEGSQVLFYKPTPTSCADCHGTNVPPVPKERSAQFQLPRPYFSKQQTTKLPFDYTKVVLPLREFVAHHVLASTIRGSLRRQTAGYTFYPRCLEPDQCRTCGYAGFLRTIKISDGMPSQGGREYLRQPSIVEAHCVARSAFQRRFPAAVRADAVTPPGRYRPCGNCDPEPDPAAPPHSPVRPL